MDDEMAWLMSKAAAGPTARSGRRTDAEYEFAGKTKFEPTMTKYSHYR
jgi:hypothetical protein